MNKPIVVIYVNPEAESTRLLNQFLARHIDQINKYIYIKRVNVTNDNVHLVRKKGIDRTPTLVYNNKKYINLENIIKVLKPPAENKDHFGYGNTGPEELIHEYHSTLMFKKEEEEGEDDETESRSKELQQKMAVLQKRRSHIDGSETKSRPKSNNQRPSFDNDEDFRRASKVDQITETPVKRYTEEEDGAILLEDYYLDMAHADGKKSTRPVRRARSH